MKPRNRTTVWTVLAVVVLGALIWMARTAPAAPKAKARAQRITAVNTVRSVSFTLTNDPALPGPRPKTGN
jgi:hypothetical protein